MTGLVATAKRRPRVDTGAALLPTTRMSERTLPMVPHNAPHEKSVTRVAVYAALTASVLASVKALVEIFQMLF